MSKKNTVSSNSVIPTERERLMQIVYVLIGIAVILLIATYTPPATAGARTQVGVADTVTQHAVDNAKVVYSYTINHPVIDAHYPRPDACRTWPIGGYDATSGIACEVADTDVHESNNDDNDDDVEITTTTPDKPSTTPDNTPTTPDPKPEKPKKNNGNHYGNSQPDNNPNDVNNKHNGCNSNCTGNGNGENKDKKEK